MALLDVKKVKSTVVLTSDEKKVILETLGYGINGNGKLTTQMGKLHICPITKQPLDFKNAAIVPGSTLVIKDDILSFADYFAQHYEIV